jgi:hypothetical protein
LASPAGREAGGTPVPLLGRQGVRGAECFAAREAIVKVVAAQRGPAFGAVL